MYTSENSIYLVKKIINSNLMYDHMPDLALKGCPWRIL